MKALAVSFSATQKSNFSKYVVVMTLCETAVPEAVSELSRAQATPEQCGTWYDSHVLPWLTQNAVPEHKHAAVSATEWL